VRATRPRAALALVALCLLLAVALAPGGPSRGTARLAGANDDVATVAEPAAPNAEAALRGSRTVDADEPAPVDALGGEVPPPDPRRPSAEAPATPEQPLPPLVAVPQLPGVDLPKPKLVACPAGGPVLLVTGVELGGEDRSVVVTGTLANTSDAPVIVEQVDLDVPGADRVAAFTEPRTLAPGESVEWTAPLPTLTVPPLLDGIAPVLGPWHWADPGVAETCPVA
jgi:hypothetical protein